MEVINHAIIRQIWEYFANPAKIMDKPNGNSGLFNQTNWKFIGAFCWFDIDAISVAQIDRAFL